LPQADSTVHGGIVCTSGRRLASLHARFAGDGRADLTVQGTSSGVTLSLTPTPTLLGRERLAALLGWPAALVPPDLVGEVVVTADSRGVTTALVAEGSIDMAELTRRLNLPPCSGSVALRLDLECSSGSASGTVAVNLADGSAQVDPLVLETFRYVFLGLLSEAAVEQGDRWTIDRIAFVVAFDGDRVSIEAGTEGRPLIAGRSEQGAALELTMPALTTLEDVARRGRLALGP